MEDIVAPEAEYKECEPRLKHWLVLLEIKYSMFRDLSRRSIGTGFCRFGDPV